MAISLINAGPNTMVAEPSDLAALMPMYPFASCSFEDRGEPGDEDIWFLPAPFKVNILDINQYPGIESFSIEVGALPTGVTGKARDCILVIDCTATGAVAPTVTWPSNFHPRTDTATDLAIVEAGKRAVFYISEYAPGEFAVGGWVETDGGYTQSGGNA